MITIIRQNQRWLLLIIAIITIIAFAWLYTADPSQLGTNQVAKLYGRTVYQIDVERVVKTYHLAANLGMEEFLMTLTIGATDEDSALNEFVWNYMVMRHEAERLGLNPAQDRILAMIQSLPAFQTDGRFDSRRFAEFLQMQLAPRGLTEQHLRDMIADALRLEMLRGLVVSPVAVGEGELREAFRGFREVDMEVVRFDFEALASEPEVSEDSVRAYFDANQEELLTNELRAARYASFTLEPDEALLEGRERIEAMQRLADRVMEFHYAVLEDESADFEALARKHGGTVVTSERFDSQGRGARTGAEPPAEREREVPSAVATAVFRVTEARPVGDIVEDGNTFHVAEMIEQVEPRAMTIEEAAPLIRPMLASRKAQDEFVAKVGGLLEQLREASAEDGALEEAAAGLGLEIEVIEALVPMETAMDERMLFARAGMELDQGEWGQLEPAPWGGFAVRVTRRAEIDEALFQAREAELRESLLEGKRGLLFVEWMQAARAQADLTPIGRRG